DPLNEHVLDATEGESKPVPQPVVTDARARKQRDVKVAPGKAIELHELKRELRPAKWIGNDGVPSLHGTGKFSVQYEGFGGPDLDPLLSKLATGKLELEVKTPAPKPEQSTAAAAFTVTVCSDFACSGRSSAGASVSPARGS